VQVVTVPHLRLSVCRLFAEELDGNAQELFRRAALVNARQLLYVRSADEFRRLETGQALHVFTATSFKPGFLYRGTPLGG
jgi:hypothetical protein